MVEYIVIIVVVGIFCIGMFMMLGKGVQSQTGFSTNKLTGATVHNDHLANYTGGTITPRVDAENARQNLMTGN